MRRSLLILFILTYSYVFGQSHQKDSLAALVKADKEDTNKVNHLNNLVDVWIPLSPDTALSYATQALKLAEKLNWTKGIGNSFFALGYFHYSQGNYENTLYNWIRALKITEKLGDKSGIARHLGNIGLVYHEQADYTGALDYYFKALKMDEELKNKNGIARHFGNIGNVYLRQADYPKALHYLSKALTIAEELGYKQLQANTLNNIGNVYKSQGNHSRAIECYLKSLKMANEFHYGQLKASALGNIGGVYFDDGDWKTALDYYFKALKLDEELGDKNEIASQLSRIGSVYTALNKPIPAEKYLLKALSLNKETGMLYQEMDVEGYLSTLYEKTGREKLALTHYKRVTFLKDTLFNLTKNKEIIRKEMSFEFDKKEALIKAENDKQAAVAKEERKKQQIIIYAVGGGLLLVAVFSLFIFNRFRITRQQKLVIEEQKILVDKAYESLHEKNKEVMDSINYASRIQRALIPSDRSVEAQLNRLHKNG